MSLIAKSVCEINKMNFMERINFTEGILILFIIVILNNIRKLNVELKKTVQLNKLKMNELIEIITSDKFVIEERVNQINTRFKKIENIINSQNDHLVTLTKPSSFRSINQKITSDTLEIPYLEHTSEITFILDQLLNFVNLKYIKIDNQYANDPLRCKIICRKGYKYKHLLKKEWLEQNYIMYNEYRIYYNQFKFMVFGKSIKIKNNR